MRRGLVRWSQKEVRLPRAHFFVDDERPDEKIVGKKNKNAPLVDIDETRANKWRLEALRLYLSLPALFYEPVYWYLPESRPFLRQMGAHPRKLLRASTCRKNVQLSPLRPSTELLRPR